MVSPPIGDPLAAYSCPDHKPAPGVLAKFLLDSDGKRDRAFERDRLLTRQDWEGPSEKEHAPSQRGQGLRLPAQLTSAGANHGSHDRGSHVLSLYDSHNPTVNFHREKRSNETHESTTDPESKLARKGKGKEAKLSYSGHVLMENRNGLCVDFSVAPATGYAERDEALDMIRRLRRRGYTPRTVAGDKGYCVGDFPQRLVDLDIRPHLAIPDSAPAASPARRFRRSAGYKVSQVIRKRVEEIFGWAKTVGGLRRTRLKGLVKTGTGATTSWPRTT